jgi:hypothetical protein
METMNKIGLSQINLMASPEEIKSAFINLGIKTLVNDCVDSEPYVEYDIDDLDTCWNKISLSFTLKKIE